MTQASPLARAATGLALAALLAGIAVPALAQAWRRVGTYEELTRLPRELAAAGLDDRIDAVFVAEPTDEALPEGLGYMLQGRGWGEALALGPDGRVTIPLRPDLVERTPVVLANNIADATLALRLRIAPPSTTRFRYAELAEPAVALEREGEADEPLIDESVDMFLVRFAAEGRHTVTLRFPDGDERSWRASRSGVLELPYRERYLEAEAFASAPIASVELRLD
jgi:hypothetical protein